MSALSGQTATTTPITLIFSASGLAPGVYSYSFNVTDTQSFTTEDTIVVYLTVSIYPDYGGSVKFVQPYKETNTFLDGNPASVPPNVSYINTSTEGKNTGYYPGWDISWGSIPCATIVGHKVVGGYLCAYTDLYGDGQTQPLTFDLVTGCPTGTIPYMTRTTIGFDGGTHWTHVVEKGPTTFGQP